MNFYVFEDGKGNYHIQNMLMGMEGQHHIHTKEDFERWKEEGKIQESNIKFMGKLKDKCSFCQKIQKKIQREQSKL